MDLLETEKMMRVAAEIISRQFPGMAFGLIVFEFFDPGIGNYISNGNREDMIKALRETADRIEKNQVIPAVQGKA